MQNNLSALQSDDMQRDVGTILGDTDYLKRQASEQTDTIAAMSQTISEMHTLLLQNTMLSWDEYTFQDSYGKQRKMSNNSESIFRHFHYSASERYGLSIALAIISIGNATNLTKRRKLLNGKL